MLTERSFDTGTVILNLAEGTTDGSPLLLLHGATMNWQSFEGYLPTLEQAWHVYALDFRGHGKSTWVPSTYQVNDYVQDVVDVIEHEIDQPVVIMGFSLGGTVTLGVAARLARRVRAVIALEPGLMIREASLQAVPDIYGLLSWMAETLQSAHTVEELIERCKALNPALDDIGAQAMAAELQCLDPTMLARLCSDHPHGDFVFEQVLPHICCPTLMVYGNSSLGGVVRERDVALIQRLVPQIQTIQLSHVGHGVMWEQAEAQTLAHVLHFLGEL